MRLGVKDALIWAFIAVGAVLVLGVVVLRQAEPVETGALIPWLPGYDVARARLLGGEFYVDTSGGVADAMTAGALAFGGIASLLASALLRRSVTVPADRVASLAMVGALACFLSADEALAVHETIGHNLGALRPPPAVDQPGNLLLFVYAAVAAGVGWRARALLRYGRLSRRLMLGTPLPAALALGLDVGPFDSYRLEEGLELIAAAIVAAGMVALAFEILQRHAVTRPLPRSNGVQAVTRIEGSSRS